MTVHVPLNPDDPDNDCPEVAVWMSIDHLSALPSLRREILSDLPRVLQHLRTPIGAASKGAKASETPPQPRMMGRSMDESDVMDYLKEHYDGDLSWVPRCTWSADNVLLKDINYENRPGGIDKDKVADMTEKLGEGWEPHPVVVVAPDADSKLETADGYHRLQSLAKAGIPATAAWVGSPKPGNTGWRADVLRMQIHGVSNHPGNQ